MKEGLGLAAGLVVYSTIANLIPQALFSRLYVPLHLALVLLLVAWARAIGLGWSDIGLNLGRALPGLGWGVLAAVALDVPLFLALLFLPSSHRLLADPRLKGLSMGGLAYRTLVRIPIGTALLEEVAFRGVLFGLWDVEKGTTMAILVSSAAFGLWHITPTFRLIKAQRPAVRPGSAIFGVALGVATTFLGGLFFGGLRWFTGGVYGPLVAHWLINALAAVVAFLAHRRLGGSESAPR